jgi:hypothetical protein
MFRKRKLEENETSPYSKNLNLIENFISYGTDYKGISITSNSSLQRDSIISSISKNFEHSYSIIQISSETSPHSIKELFNTFQSSLQFQNYENSPILEGEVTNIEYSFSSFDKSNCSSGKITLNLGNMESLYHFGPFLATKLFKLRIKVGDFVKIDTNQANVIKTCSTFKNTSTRSIVSLNLSDIPPFNCIDSYSLPFGEYLWENLSVKLNNTVSDNKLHISRRVIICEILEYNEIAFSLIEKLLENFYSPFLILLSARENLIQNTCFLRGLFNLKIN